MKLKQVISNLWFIINWFMRQLIFFSPRARFAFKAGPPYYKGTLIKYIWKSRFFIFAPSKTLPQIVNFWKLFPTPGYRMKRNIYP